MLTLYLTHTPSEFPFPNFQAFVPRPSCPISAEPRQDVSQIWVMDIEYESGKPRLANKRLVLDTRKLPFKRWGDL